MTDAAVLQVRAIADISQAERGLNSLGQQVSSFGSTVKEGFAIGAGIALFQAGLSALGQAYGALKGSVIDFNQTLDQQRAVFERYFGGSKEQAEAFLNTLKLFAAQTPFEFKDLAQLAVRLQNANISANDIIPTIKAIGNASSATGQLSQEELGRITLALTQMQAKGKLMGDELGQLREANVNLGPVYEELAKKMGKPIEQIERMATSGQISAKAFLEAFRAAYENAGLMEKAATTLEGAMSTIRDFTTQALSDMGRSFYELARDIANSIASALDPSTDTGKMLQGWVQAGKIGLDSLAQSVRNLAAYFGPLGEAIGSAFAKLGAGDVSGAFSTLSEGFNTQLKKIWNDVTSFASSMLGAGQNVIGQFVAGLYEGARDVLVGAMDFITSFIADLLIGRSPIPNGPLSQLAAGGENAAKQWTTPFGEKMKEGATAAVEDTKKVVEGLQDTLRGIGKQVRGITEESQDLDKVMRGLSDKATAIKEQFAAQLEAVRSVGEATKKNYDETIRGIRAQMETIADSHEAVAKRLQKQIDDIGNYYKPLIEGIKSQIDGIKEHYDAIADSIQRAADAIKDKFAPQIEGLKSKIESTRSAFEKQELTVQKQIEAIQGRYGPAIDALKAKIQAVTEGETAQLAPLQKQLQLLQSANKFVKERQDAENAIRNAKIQQLLLESEGDPSVRAALLGQQAALQNQQERLQVTQDLEEAQKKLAAGGLSPAEQLSLENKIRQLTVQKQLLELTDQTKLSEATRQNALNEATQKQVGLQEAIGNAQQKLLEIPLEEKMAKIQAAAQAALEPLTAQLKSLEEKEKTSLAPLQERLKNLKNESEDVLRPLQERLKSLEDEQKKALDPLTARMKSVKDEERDVLLPLTQRLKELEKNQKTALEPLVTSLKAVKDEEKTLLEPLQERLKNVTQAAEVFGRAFQEQLAAIGKQQEEQLRPIEEQLKGYEAQKRVLSDQRQELERISAQIRENIADLQDAEKKAKEAEANRPKDPTNKTFTGDPAAKEAIEAAKKRGEELAKNVSEGMQKWLEENKTKIAESLIGGVFGFIFGGPVGAAAGALFLPAFIDSLNKKLKERGFDAQPFLDAFTVSVNEGDYSRIAEGIAYGLTRAILAIPYDFAKGLWKAFFSLFSSSATPDEGDKQSIGGAIIKGIWRGIVDEAKREFTENVDDLWNLLTEILRRSALTFGGPFIWLGQSIINGVVKGLEVIQPVIDAIFKLGSDLVQKFKETLGIASPSTVFQEIGSNIIEGLYNGLITGWASTLQGWWSDFGDLIQRTLGWNGGALSWVDSLKSIGLTIIQNIKEGHDSYWTSTLSKWWTDFPGTIMRTFGWDESTLTWAGSLISAGTSILSNLKGGQDAGWTGFLFRWWTDFPSVIQTTFGWTGENLTWGDTLKTIGFTLLQRLKEGQDNYWITSLFKWWTDFPGAIQSAFGWVGGVFTWVEQLKTVGGAILQGIYDGIVGKVEDFKTWVKQGFVDLLPGWLKDMLDIHSPSALMMPIGEALIDGIIAGMEKKVPMLKSLIGGIRGMIPGDPGGSGAPVTGDLHEWIVQAMRAENVDPGKWENALGWLAMHESGGQADPPHNNNARGVMQTIPSTFGAFRDPNLPNDIFNPIANIAAAIRYIQQEYETGRKTGYPIDINGIISQWGRPGFFQGGYGTGGIAWGPQMANLAEFEPEVIIPRSWFQKQSSSTAGSSGGSGEIQTHLVKVQWGKQSLADFWVQGREVAIEQRRVPTSGTIY